MLSSRTDCLSWQKNENINNFKSASEMSVLAKFHHQQVSSFLPSQDLISKIGISAACSTPAATLP
jgi:hypothetical protein